MNRLFKKSIAILLVFLILITPTANFAQTTGTPAVPSGNSGQATGNVQQSEFEANAAAAAIGEAVGTCSVGSLIGAYVSGYISKAVGELMGFLNSGISNIAQNQINQAVSQFVDINLVVPVRDNLATDNLADLNLKETGKSHRWSIMSGLTSNFIQNPSLDAIGYCFANEMIRYIGQSTVDWINGGFEGNPVFLENPEAFFKNIADVEAGSFITEVAAGAGVNICEPFRVQVVINTLNSYSQGGYGNRASCTLDQIKNNYEQFVNGDWNSGGFPGWLELVQRQNNPYGATYLTRLELARQISSRQETQKEELNRNQGYQTFRVCDKTRLDGSYDPASCKTVTPGNYVKSQVDARAYAPLLRLTLADEFDEIVTALVNQLVKVAVNKMLESASD